MRARLWDSARITFLSRYGLEVRKVCNHREHGSRLATHQTVNSHADAEETGTQLRERAGLQPGPRAEAQRVEPPRERHEQHAERREGDPEEGHLGSA